MASSPRIRCPTTCCGSARQQVPGRLQIRDGALAATFAPRAGRIRQLGRVAPRARLKMVGFSLAVVASALLATMFAVPAMVERMTPLIRLGVEQRLGVSLDARYRASLASDPGDGSECGQGPNEQASRAAFDKLVSRLQTAAGLPFPVRAAVVRHAQANAATLAGGHVYVFKGDINEARTPDELAAAIAHEMGQVAHRDSVRPAIQAIGPWLLFGSLTATSAAAAPPALRCTRCCCPPFRASARRRPMPSAPS